MSVTVNYLAKTFIKKDFAYLASYFRKMTRIEKWMRYNFRGFQIERKDADTLIAIINECVPKAPSNWIVDKNEDSK